MKKNIYAHLNHSAVHQRPPQQSRPTIFQIKKMKRKEKAHSKQKEQLDQRYTSTNTISMFKEPQVVWFGWNRDQNRESKIWT